MKFSRNRNYKFPLKRITDRTLNKLFSRCSFGKTCCHSVKRSFSIFFPKESKEGFYKI